MWIPRVPKACTAALIPVCVIMLTACGGGSAGSGPAGNGPLPAVSGSPAPLVVISQSGSSITITGQITALFTGGFYVYGGKGVGNEKILTTSSTVVTGPALFVGEQVEITGTGSTSTSITATSVSQYPPATSSPSPTTTAPAVGATTPAPTGSPIPVPTGIVQVGGPIVALITGGFTIKGMPSYGYMHIYTSSSTKYANGTPVVGQYAYVTGTGKLGYSVTANYVSQFPSAPSSASVSGTVAAQTPYGFTLQTPTSQLPVSMTSTTVIGGGTLAVGAQVTVTGTGSASVGIVAVQIVVATPTPPPAQATPTPGPIAMQHVLTGDYLGGYYGTKSVAWTTAAKYLTWAQTNLADASAIAATGIKTQDYVDPNRLQGSGDPMWGYTTNNEGAFTHDCSGNRITYSTSNYATTYVMNPGDATYESSFHSWTASQASQAHMDAMFEDDVTLLSTLQNVGTFTPGLPCNYSDSGWVTAQEALNAASAVPVIINGMPFFNGSTLATGAQILDDPNTIGDNFEHCYSDTSTPKSYGSLWQVTENTEIYVDGRNKLFECMLRNLNTASTSTEARIYAYASFLLTYNPQTSIYWEEFATTSGLHVFPEEELVALDPLVPTPSDVSSLQVQGGAYGREYAQCYIAGQFVGTCAVAVNPDPNFAKPFPYPQYTHTLVLSGAGIVDGGTIATNGPQPPTYLQPEQAEIVFP